MVMKSTVIQTIKYIGINRNVLGLQENVLRQPHAVSDFRWRLADNPGLHSPDFVSPSRKIVRQCLTTKS